MSDDEYSFEYSDDEAVAADDATVRAENAYYGAKAKIVAGDAAAARAEFAGVIALEREAAAGAAGDVTEWAFKAAKQVVKMDFRAGDLDAMLAGYKCVGGARLLRP